MDLLIIYFEMTLWSLRAIILRQRNESTYDWYSSSDWKVGYAEHNKFQRKYARELMERRPISESVLYKQILNPSFCPKCLELATKQGKGSEPIRFKKSELFKTNLNAIKPKQLWRIYVGSTYPNCRCEITAAPKGISIWDKEKQKFKMVLNSREQEILSQLRYTITND
jgi:hypothetical protein